MNADSRMNVDDLEIEYALADYTEPWREDAPETILLHHGYCRNMALAHPDRISALVLCDTLASGGYDVVLSSPKQCVEFIRSDVKKWADLMGSAGIEVE